MVLIAVAGGTGLAGRAVVAHAVAAGHQVRSLSRYLPALEKRVAGAEYIAADFRAGTGVRPGLAGVDVLIETLDARSGAALRALPIMSVAVLDAAAKAGIFRCVLLTIINAGECATGYYQAQAARALSYKKSGMPTTVVEAAQFHNLVAGIFSAGAKVGIIPAFRGISFQSLSTPDLAEVLVTQALRDGAEKHLVFAGGPDAQSMQQMAQVWKSVTASKSVVTPLPLPGSLGVFLRAGKNLLPDLAAGSVGSGGGEHALGSVGFGEWLASRATA
ncbi:hypothetical protein AS189_05740 [Arthrobacter alpinus]|uniref:NAD(P)-binding domain-containing protein n=1 Tax=Arthrobacter alpinus TaxID=656366 RepID=A0A0S2LX30_9MICC|nr:NAD(P)H-binding protein [Arthrobacter alpinus]ALO66089.1 hypothetical protein AS189_05740 [Arthrobacter alpinus]